MIRSSSAVTYNTMQRTQPRLTVLVHPLSPSLSPVEVLSKATSPEKSPNKSPLLKDVTLTPGFDSNIFIVAEEMRDLAHSQKVNCCKKYAKVAGFWAGSTVVASGTGALVTSLYASSFTIFTLEGALAGAAIGATISTGAGLLLLAGTICGVINF